MFLFFINIVKNIEVNVFFFKTSPKIASWRQTATCCSTMDYALSRFYRQFHIQHQYLFILSYIKYELIFALALVYNYTTNAIAYIKRRLQLHGPI